jgi:hypothetical protein
MPHIHISEATSYYYPPIYAWVFQVVSFPQVSPPKLCIHRSSYTYVKKEGSETTYQSHLLQTIRSNNVKFIEGIIIKM